MFDIIVIGAGTAGLSAAIYAVRAGKSVLVLEGKSYGGQIINTPSVENYPGIKNVSGFEFATNLYEQAIELGARVEFEKVTKIIDEKDTKLVVIDREKTYSAKSIIIATGTVNRKLGIDRENELVGKGVSYCATCDGAFYRGKDVAVVGGGSTALEDAAFLSNYCNKVYLIHRRNRFRGEDTLVKTLEAKENVEFVLSSKVIKLDGKDKIESIEVETTTEYVQDEKIVEHNQGERVIEHEQEEKTIECEQDEKVTEYEQDEKVTEYEQDERTIEHEHEEVMRIAECNDIVRKVKSIDISGLFIAIGQVPSNEIFREIIELDDYGYILATENCKTNIEGIFVAGDCRTKKVRQLTTAASDGAIAGLAACEYIG